MGAPSPNLPPARRSKLTYITVAEDIERVRVCFSGEVDLASSDLIDLAVCEALLFHHPRHVEVDLAEVRFLDASGIRVLLHCRERSVEVGCQFAVVNPQPLVYRIMELTGVLVALSVTWSADKRVER
jgi:anti-anti-sigma factor